MVKGLEVFKRYFEAYSDQYVLIGGTACNLLFEDAGVTFRATKDLDMVLIVEALTPEFGRVFWMFIQDGQYKNRAKSNGSPQFFRFDKPKTAGFPFMIELFSRTESVLSSMEQNGLVPLHLDDEISSLSAILLNEDYYQMLLAGRQMAGELVILAPEYLILFKAKAWLELSARKEAGEPVDSRDIKKHKNDIVRLAAILTGEEKCNLMERVKQDMKDFVERLQSEEIDFKALQLPRFTKESLVTLLRKLYVD